MINAGRHEQAIRGSGVKENAPSDLHMGLMRLDGGDLRVVEEVEIGVLAEWGGRWVALLWADE